jgi:hypothetical protein
MSETAQGLLWGAGLIAGLVLFGWLTTTDWYKRTSAKQLTAEEARRYAASEAMRPAPLSIADVAGAGLGCMGIALVVGLIGLVVVAVVLWSWRTVFGG